MNYLSDPFTLLKLVEILLRSQEPQRPTGKGTLASNTGKLIQNPIIAKGSIAMFHGPSRLS